MALTTTLRINVVAPPTTPGTPAPKLVITPNPVTIEQGKVVTVSVKVDDNGVLSNPVGILRAFWVGANNGISAFIKNNNSIELHVPSSAAVGPIDLTVDVA